MAAAITRFVELCARTAFSGLSIDGPVEGKTVAHGSRGWPGGGTPEGVVVRVRELGQSTVGITDVDTVAGVVRAFTRGKDEGVRVIPGCELALDEGPLIVLPSSPQGWANLCRILTKARSGLRKGEIAYVLDDVLADVSDLWGVALSPMQDSALPKLREAFGDRLSLAVWRHLIPEDEPRLRHAQRWSRQLNVPLLATARPILLTRDQKRFHDVLTRMRQGLTLHDGAQRLLPNGEAHLRSDVEMARLFHAHPQALARSVEVAEACIFELGQLRYAFPDDHLDGLTADQRLRQRSFAGARLRCNVDSDDQVPTAMRQQIDKELSLIAELEVAPYFLTVHEIVDMARSRSILCQGRGSAANSVICYCLGITSIDPVRMGLLFERFMSANRKEPPDIDVDFEHERREEVIQAIYQRWGRDHAAMVTEVISFRTRSSIREIGKVLGVHEDDIARINSLTTHRSADNFVADLQQAGIETQAPVVAETLKLAEQLKGYPRHLGIHVGGFVLTAAPITTLSPVEPARMDNRTVLPFDKDDVDALGLFKMDVLGLGMLTCIRKTLTLLNTDRVGQGHAALTLATIPAEDSVVYDAICRADTIGVFQIESRAQMSMLPRLRPRCFYDLVVEVALVRPGPIQGDMVHPYLRRRQGKEAPTMPHESLRPVLERTLGIPLFQEQVMRIAMIGANYDAGQADQLRRDMAAWKRNGKLERHREPLLAGFAAHGIEASFALRLYEQMKGFADYGFPESHAASFALLVYVSAWLKTHHPALFAAALINSLPMGFYAPSQIVSDVQAHQVEVRAIDVNHSNWDCTIETAEGKPALRLGLRLVKGLAEKVGQAIMVERGQGLFTDVNELMHRVSIDKKNQQSLARAGALDTISHDNRRQALWHTLSPRLPLLRMVSDDNGDALTPLDEEQRMRLDYRHVGLSIDDHPMKHVRPRLVDALAAHEKRKRTEPPALVTTAELAHIHHGRVVRIAGMVTGRQRPGTADGTCFITLEDEGGLVNVVVWGRDFERQRVVIISAAFLLVMGRVERESSVVHVIAKQVVGVRDDGTTTAMTTLDDDPLAQLTFPFEARSFR